LAEDVERTQAMLNSHNNLIVRREEMDQKGDPGVCGISKEF